MSNIKTRFLLILIGACSVVPISHAKWLGIQLEYPRTIKFATISLSDEDQSIFYEIFIPSLSPADTTIWYEVENNNLTRIAPIWGMTEKFSGRWMHRTPSGDDEKLIIWGEMKEDFTLLRIAKDGYVDTISYKSPPGAFLVRNHINNINLAVLPADPSRFELSNNRKNEEQLISELTAKMPLFTVPEKFSKNANAASCYLSGARNGWYSAAISNLNDISPFIEGFLGPVLGANISHFSKTDIELFVNSWRSAFWESRGSALKAVAQ